MPQMFTHLKELPTLEQFGSSGWLGLNNTQEKVVALSSAGSTGGASGVSFMRCSVQAHSASMLPCLK